MLEQIIKANIKEHGPMPLDKFIELVLYHNKYGFYTTQNVLGKDGAFTTAPEISQMFGEMIGVYFANIWINMGKCKDLSIVELGPGNGTLMSDFLRATQNIPNFHRSIKQINLLEISPKLISKQRKILSQFDDININWYDDIDDILGACKGSSKTFIIANEFLDALPVKQFAENGEERMIKLDTANDMLEFSFADDRVCHEISELSDSVIRKIASFFDVGNRGQALIIDYGYYFGGSGDKSSIKNKNLRMVNKDSLQAICGHRFSSPLENIGRSDITYHVDFDNIENILKQFSNVEYSPPITQGEFLKGCGIEIRANELKKHDVRQAERIDNELYRITIDMSSIFKVFTFWNYKS